MCMYYCIRTDNPDVIAGILKEEDNGLLMHVVKAENCYTAVIRKYQNDTYLEENLMNKEKLCAPCKIAICGYLNDSPKSAFGFVSNTEEYSQFQLDSVLELLAR